MVFESFSFSAEELVCPDFLVDQSIPKSFSTKGLGHKAALTRIASKNIFRIHFQPFNSLQLKKSKAIEINDLLILIGHENSHR